MSGTMSESPKGRIGRTPYAALILNAVLMMLAALALTVWGVSAAQALPPTWSTPGQAYQGVASFPPNLIGLRPLLATIAVRNVIFTVAGLAALNIVMLVVAPWNRRPTVRFMFLSQLLIVAGGLASLEFSLERALGPYRGYNFMYPDPLRHWRYNPYTSNNKYVADANGLRGLEAPVEKQPNEFRILVLGDSISAGSNLAEKHTYAWVLQAYLRKKFPDLLIRVKNGAADGYSIHQNIAVLNQIYKDYRPDLVICEFTHVNEEIVQLYEHGALKWAPIRALRRRLFDLDLYLWLRRELNASEASLGYEAARQAPGVVESHDPVVMMDGLNSLKKFADEHGIQLVFYIPYFHNAPQAGDNGAIDSGPPNMVLAFVNEHGYPCINLAEKWKTVPNITSLLQDTHHPNVPGTVMQGEDIANFLIENDLVKVRR